MARNRELSRMAPGRYDEDLEGKSWGEQASRTPRQQPGTAVREPNPPSGL